MFESLFPKKDGKWTAVWVFNFVDPWKYRLEMKN
jgi:hypothetical protein